MADDKRLELGNHRGRRSLGPLLADRDKLEKIVLNLVFNALKFTPAGGTVELRAEKQDEQLVLTVTDTGMGISAKNLPFIFDRFWQADDSSKRKYQGVGIGLALVKELTEVQGGKVAVESQEGKGTTFTVQPALHQKPRAAVARSRAKRRRGSRRRRPNASAGMQSEEWLTNFIAARNFSPP